MRYTNNGMIRTFVMVLIMLLASTSLFAAMAVVADNTQELIIPSGVSSVTIDLVVNENEPYAGIEFGLTHTDGLTFNEYTMDNGISPALSTPFVEKSDIHYFGFFTSDNVFSGKQTVGKLKFTYTGNEEQTITITKMTVGRIVDKDAVGTVKDSPAYTFIVKRQVPGGNPTNGKPVIPPVTPIVVTLSDISGHWAEKNIMSAVEKGFVSGYPDGTFRPDNPVTRAEFITMLVKASDMKNADKGFTFSDIVNHWASENIMIAISNELVNGYPDGTFRPNNDISRQEVAKIVASYKALSEAEAVLPFNDVKDIGSWALPYVNKVYNAKIMQGDNNNNFTPLANTTRAQAVVTILRCMN